MSLLDLVGRVFLNATGWERGLAQVNQQTNTATSKLASQLKNRLAGAFSAGAAIAASRAIIDYTSNIKDMADRLGVSTDRFQAWGFAAEQTGAKVEDVTKAVERLANAQEDAVTNPKGQMAKAFADLGIKAEEIRSLSLEDLFLRVSRAVNEGTQSAAQMAAMVDLLGRGMGKLRPAFKEGLDEMERMAKLKGVIIDEATIQLVEKYGDKWQEAGTKVKKAGAETVGYLAKRHENLTTLAQNYWDFVKTMFGAPFHGDKSIQEHFRPLAERFRARELAAEEFSGERIFRADRRDKPPGGSEEDINVLIRARLARERAAQFEDEDRFFASPERFTKQFEKEEDIRQVIRNMTQRPTDALASVGNFLGASTDPTASGREIKQEIAKTNMILQQQLQNTEELKNAMLQIAAQGAAFIP